jgi:hypothetical protein
MARARRRRAERDCAAALLFVTLPLWRTDRAATVAFALRLERLLPARAERPRLDFAPFFTEAVFDAADFLPDAFLEAVRRCLASALKFKEAPTNSIRRIWSNGVLKTHPDFLILNPFLCP